MDSDYRIDRVMRALGQIWRLNPELRINQLIFNLQKEYWGSYMNMSPEILYEKECHDNITAYSPREYYNLFFVQDESFVEFLESFLEKAKIKRGLNNE